MTNPIQFQLSYDNGKQRLWLPVNPSVIGVSTTHGYNDVEATQLGEYTIIGKRKLDEISFSSFFPANYDASYCSYNPVPDPWECVQRINHWKRTGNPARLTIVGTPINMAVTIRDFSYEAERGGSPGDIYYDLTLKEYAFVRHRRVNVANNSATVAADSARPETSDKPTRYEVAYSDSLWKIAQKTEVYGDGDKWRTIYNANKAVIGANPSVIKVGQTLVIPR